MAWNKRWRRPFRVGRAGIFVVSAALATLPARADPVVVELFTSQGCSSCPPADANLITVSARPDVLALSFGVTFWDDLGWRDTFAKAEFTQRQLAYEGPLGHAGAFTPQIVVNGRADVVGNNLGELQALIDRAVPESTSAGRPAILLAGQQVSIGAGPAPARPADIWLVRYDPDTTQVPVARGENRHRVLAIRHAVRSLTRLGFWQGEAVEFALPPTAPGLESAVLVQVTPGGEILAAKKL